MVSMACHSIIVSLLFCLCFYFQDITQSFHTGFVPDSRTHPLTPGDTSQLAGTSPGRFVQLVPRHRTHHRGSTGPTVLGTDCVVVVLRYSRNLFYRNEWEVKRKYNVQLIWWSFFAAKAVILPTSRVQGDNQREISNHMSSVVLLSAPKLSSTHVLLSAQCSVPPASLTAIRLHEIPPTQDATRQQVIWMQLRGNNIPSRCKNRDIYAENVSNKVCSSYTKKNRDCLTGPVPLS